MVYVTVSERVQPQDENTILDSVNEFWFMSFMQNISLSDVLTWIVKLFNLMVVKIIDRKQVLMCDKEMKMLFLLDNRSYKATDSHAKLKMIKVN